MESKKLINVSAGIFTLVAIGGSLACGDIFRDSTTIPSNPPPVARTSGETVTPGESAAPNAAEDTSKTVGSPTTTAMFGGDGQAAVVGTAVPIRPAFLLTDAQGEFVSGVEVTFAVTKGGGTVTEAVVPTGDDGVATVGSWILGPTPGENELKAEVPGLAPVFYRATANPDDRGSFTKERGDFQMARVGSGVGIAPRVVVKTREGNPVANRRISFQVVEGGGSVAPEEVTSDSNGFASTLSWTLGSTPGRNVLRARLDGLPDLEFIATAVSNTDPVLVFENVLTGLSSPWEIAFLPSGDMLFTERVGRIRLLRVGEVSATTLVQVSDVNSAGQSGLLGLAIDPGFASNRTFYTYLSASSNGVTTNRIRKWTLASDSQSASAVGDILSGISWGADGSHSGGRLRFGDDGFLYASTGDIRSANVPQDLTQLGGKILRVTTAGAPAPGNPTLTQGARQEIFTFGHRNTQGLAVRPADLGGGLFTCEHGPNQDDEVSPLVAGGNGGWNPNDGNGNYNGYSGAKMTDVQRYPNAVRPLYVQADSEGMSSCVFLRGSQWKSWEGSLLVSFLAGERAIVLDVDRAGTGLARAVRSGFGSLGRIRAVAQGPDGFLYVSIDPTGGALGRIVRIKPE